MMSRTAFVARLGRVEARLPRLHQAVPTAGTLLQACGVTPDPWQAQVLASEAPRLLLCCCRQSGKSFVSACLALHTAMVQAGALVLLLSPSLRQSQELFYKVLTLYRPQASQTSATQETALRLTLSNGARIISLPGTEQTVRGYSAVDLLIVDEAARVHDELYFSVRPMLAVSHGRMVCLSTPFGRRGWYFHEWSQGEGWERVRIPASQCPRIREAFLSEERRSLPPLWYQSEYACEFVDTVAQVFASADIEAALRDDVQPLFAAR